MTATELYQEGRLRDAIAAATEGVKKHPADTSRRGFLAELLCFAGELERADKQLEAIAQQDPEMAVGITLFRQLLRAATARQQFFATGRLPEFFGRPSKMVQQHLEASICLRQGELEEAARLLDQAEQQRPRISGTCDAEPFDDLRDLDDLTAPLLEVLTSNGKYYWIPMAQVESVELHPPQRPRDLLWRRARVVVAGGPDGEVFLPTLYPGTVAHADDQLRLGRGTDWSGGEGTPVCGTGLRMFLVGEEGRSILEIAHLALDHPTPVDAESADDAEGDT